jgi:hypothetical protein
MPSKRQREEERPTNASPEQKTAVAKETLLTLQIAQHHRSISSSWKTGDPTLSADIQEYLTTPFELALVQNKGSTAGAVKSVELNSGAWRNVPIALPGEGVVYATVTVSSMKTTNELE